VLLAGFDGAEWVEAARRVGRVVAPHRRRSIDVDVTRHTDPVYPESARQPGVHQKIRRSGDQQVKGSPDLL
jgi:hypothetical protein